MCLPLPFYARSCLLTLANRVPSPVVFLSVDLFPSAYYRFLCKYYANTNLQAYQRDYNQFKRFGLFAQYAKIASRTRTKKSSGCWIIQCLIMTSYTTATSGIYATRLPLVVLEMIIFFFFGSSRTKHSDCIQEDFSYLVQLLQLGINSKWMRWKSS